MAGKTIKYEAVGCRIEAEPYSVTGTAVLVVAVRTKKGAWVNLRLSGVGVDEAKCLRRTANQLCAKFKNLASELYHSL